LAVIVTEVKEKQHLSPMVNFLYALKAPEETERIHTRRQGQAG
jgi:hypothetical protein